MAYILEDNMNWSQLCDHTIDKINLSSKDEPVFRRWFMSREKVGYRLDPITIFRCFNIWKELKNNLDHFIVISGREGYGKSTLSFHIAAWVTPDGFDMGNVCYGARQYLDILDLKAKESLKPDSKILNTSIVMDEGTELLSREALNVTNRVLTKSFFIQRVLKFLVITNIPNFFMLDTVIRLHRVRTLIQVLDRGHMKVITGKGISKICKEGMLHKDVNAVCIPDGTFWHGSWRKKLPLDMDYEEYEQYKLESVAQAISDMKDDVVQKKMIAVGKVAKEIGSSRLMITAMIKRGEVEGKQIASKWYITRKAYDKLLTV